MEKKMCSKFQLGKPSQTLTEEDREQTELKNIANFLTARHQEHGVTIIGNITTSINKKGI